MCLFNDYHLFPVSLFSPVLPVTRSEQEPRPPPPIPQRLWKPKRTSKTLRPVDFGASGLCKASAGRDFGNFCEEIKAAVLSQWTNLQVLRLEVAESKLWPQNDCLNCYKYRRKKRQYRETYKNLKMFSLYVKKSIMYGTDVNILIR